VLRPVIPARSAFGCTVNGLVTASRQPLPGVVVTLRDGQGRTLDASSSGADGRSSSARRHRLVHADGVLVAFAPISRDIATERHRARSASI
jgi:outer membrane receptor for Fe3+-dicitrate